MTVRLPPALATPNVDGPPAPALATPNVDGPPAPALATPNVDGPPAPALATPNVDGPPAPALATPNVDGPPAPALATPNVDGPSAPALATPNNAGLPASSILAKGNIAFLGPCTVTPKSENKSAALVSNVTPQASLVLDPSMPTPSTSEKKSDYKQQNPSKTSSKEKDDKLPATEGAFLENLLLGPAEVTPSPIKKDKAYTPFTVVNINRERFRIEETESIAVSKKEVKERKARRQKNIARLRTSEESLGKSKSEKESSPFYFFPVFNTNKYLILKYDNRLLQAGIFHFYQEPTEQELKSLNWNTGLINGCTTALCSLKVLLNSNEKWTLSTNNKQFLEQLIKQIPDGSEISQIDPLPDLKNFISDLSLTSLMINSSVAKDEVECKIEQDLFLTERQNHTDFSKLDVNLNPKDIPGEQEYNLASDNEEFQLEDHVFHQTVNERFLGPYQIDLAVSPYQEEEWLQELSSKTSSQNFILKYQQQQLILDLTTELQLNHCNGNDSSCYLMVLIRGRELVADLKYFSTLTEEKDSLLSQQDKFFNRYIGLIKKYIASKYQKNEVAFHIINALIKSLEKHKSESIDVHPEDTTLKVYNVLRDFLKKFHQEQIKNGSLSIKEEKRNQVEIDTVKTLKLSSVRPLLILVGNIDYIRVTIKDQPDNCKDLQYSKANKVLFISVSKEVSGQLEKNQIQENIQELKNYLHYYENPSVSKEILKTLVNAFSKSLLEGRERAAVFYSPGITTERAYVLLQNVFEAFAQEKSEATIMKDFTQQIKRRHLLTKGSNVYLQVKINSLASKHTLEAGFKQVTLNGFATWYDQIFVEKYLGTLENILKKIPHNKASKSKVYSSLYSLISSFIQSIRDNCKVTFEAQELHADSIKTALEEIIKKIDEGDKKELEKFSTEYLQYNLTAEFGLRGNISLKERPKDVLLEIELSYKEIQARLIRRGILEQVGKLQVNQSVNASINLPLFTKEYVDIFISSLLSRFKTSSNNFAFLNAFKESLLTGKPRTISLEEKHSPTDLVNYLDKSLLRVHHSLKQNYKPGIEVMLELIGEIQFIKIPTKYLQYNLTAELDLYGDTSLVERPKDVLLEIKLSGKEIQARLIRRGVLEQVGKLQVNQSVNASINLPLFTKEYVDIFISTLLSRFNTSSSTLVFLNAFKESLLTGKPRTISLKEKHSPTDLANYLDQSLLRVHHALKQEYKPSNMVTLELGKLIQQGRRRTMPPSPSKRSNKSLSSFNSLGKDCSTSNLRVLWSWESPGYRKITIESISLKNEQFSQFVITASYEIMTDRSLTDITEIMEGKSQTLLQEVPSLMNWLDSYEDEKVSNKAVKALITAYRNSLEKESKPAIAKPHCELSAEQVRQTFDRVFKAWKEAKCKAKEEAATENVVLTKSHSVLLSFNVINVCGLSAAKGVEESFVDVILEIQLSSEGIQAHLTLGQDCDSEQENQSHDVAVIMPSLTQGYVKGVLRPLLKTFKPDSEEYKLFEALINSLLEGKTVSALTNSYSREKVVSTLKQDLEKIHQSLQRKYPISLAAEIEYTEVQGSTGLHSNQLEDLANVFKLILEKGQRKAEGTECQAEEEVKRKAEEEAKRQAQEEAKRKVEEEAKRKAEEEAKRKAEEEAKRKAEEEAKHKAEEEAKRKAEEEAERKAKEEAKRKAEEEAERKAKEEAERKAKEEAERKANEEEAERKAKEEAERKAREEVECKAREEAKRQAEEEAKRQAKKLMLHQQVGRNLQKKDEQEPRPSSARVLNKVALAFLIFSAVVATVVVLTLVALVLYQAGMLQSFFETSQLAPVLQGMLGYLQLIDYYLISAIVLVSSICVGFFSTLNLYSRREDSGVSNNLDHTMTLMPAATDSVLADLPYSNQLAFGHKPQAFEPVASVGSYDITSSSILEPTQEPVPSRSL